MIGQSNVQREQVEGLHRLIGMDLIRDWTLAIDGGAHVGTWAAVMAGHFERVIAFEPTPETFEMLVENMDGFTNVECRNEALMASPGRVSMAMPSHSHKHRRATGKTINDGLSSRYVRRDGAGGIQAITIDSLELSSCGLIKLDLEGAEPLALEGARKTIGRFRPILAVEIKNHSERYGIKQRAVKNLIQDLGYKEKFRRRYDLFYAYG